MLKRKTVIIEFQSPFGEMVLQRKGEYTIMEIIAKVSVPFRGNGTSTTEEEIKKQEEQGFSPLSGKWYFNVPRNRYENSWLCSVSVPFRGNGTSTPGQSTAIAKSPLLSFSPLSGKWYFNSMPLYDCRNDMITGFSPLSGKWYFN